MEDDHFKLMIREYSDKERKTSNELYSRKYIEKAITWLFGSAAAIVLGLVVTALWSLAASHFKS